MKTPSEIYLYPSIYALTFHRYGHNLYLKKNFFLARLISQFARALTGIEIHPGANVGQRVFFDHGSGVVIGETAEIGDECVLFHGVTLGSVSKGEYKQGEKRHPTLGKGVFVGVGASILGPIYIGDNARIGAGAVALKDLPENCTAVGVPAKIVNQRANSEQAILNFIIWILISNNFFFYFFLASLFTTS